MLKVLKFGGSSMADAHQLEKVRSIVEADPARRVVVVSAAGKRFKDDHKITDLLYLCHAHLQYGVSCDGIFDMVRSRYLEIRDELGLSTPLEAEFDALRAKMDKGISADELVSRGEYFAARIMADCLGFDFLDSSLWLHFRMDGTVDQEASYQALIHAASGRKVVIPGFYGAFPDGGVRTFSRGMTQRLSIARALVKKAPIYIFDDTFSALDFKTDARLCQALKGYTENATVFIVAQRVSTIMHAEQIVVLDEGKVVGIGTHEQLLGSCEEYQEIYWSQNERQEAVAQKGGER